jgi:hypothetical protein
MLAAHRSDHRIAEYWAVEPSARQPSYPHHGKLPPPTFTMLLIEERPHDATRTARGWSFKTLEHDEHMFPHAIKATDARGRSAIYVPLKRRGKIGRWFNR